MRKNPRAFDTVMVDDIPTTAIARELCAQANRSLIQRLDQVIISARPSNAAAIASLAYMLGEHLAWASTQTPDGEAEKAMRGVHGVIDLVYAFHVKAQVNVEPKRRKRT